MSRSPAGFEEFARASARSLSGRAYLLCQDHHLAEDLVQETLARMYVRWRHIDDVESPAGYARAALTNAYIDRTRRRSHHEPPLAEVADTGVPDQVDGVPRRVTLRRVVGVSRCGRALTGHFTSGEFRRPAESPADVPRRVTLRRMAGVSRYRRALTGHFASGELRRGAGSPADLPPRVT